MSETAWDYLEREIKKEVRYYEKYCDISSGLTKHAGLIYALKKVVIARDMQVKEIEAMKKLVKTNNRRDDFHREERNKVIEEVLKTIRPEPERSDDDD